MNFNFNYINLSSYDVIIVERDGKYTIVSRGGCVNKFIVGDIVKISDEVMEHYATKVQFETDNELKIIINQDKIEKHTPPIYYDRVKIIIGDEEKETEKQTIINFSASENNGWKKE